MQHEGLREGRWERHSHKVQTLRLTYPILLPCFLQIGTAVAVIAITAINLGNVQSLQDVWKLNQKFCLASADPKNMSVCTYIYAVGAVSIVLTILIGLLQVSSSTAWAVG